MTTPLTGNEGRSYEDESYSIRGCQRADLEVVYSIERQCFDDTSALPMIALVQYYDLFSPFIFVALKSDVIIGFAISAPVCASPTDAWLLDVAVSHEYKRLGIGTTLCKHAMRSLGAAGAATFFATVTPINQASLAMLRRLGFQYMFEARNYFGVGQDRLVTSTRPIDSIT